MGTGPLIVQHHDVLAVRAHYVFGVFSVRLVVPELRHVALRLQVELAVVHHLRRLVAAQIVEFSLKSIDVTHYFGITGK